MHGVRLQHLEYVRHLQTRLLTHLPTVGVNASLVRWGESLELAWDSERSQVPASSACFLPTPDTPRKPAGELVPDSLLKLLVYFSAAG